MPNLNSAASFSFGTSMHRKKSIRKKGDHFHHNTHGSAPQPSPEPVYRILELPLTNDEKEWIRRVWEENIGRPFLTKRDEVMDLLQALRVPVPMINVVESLETENRWVTQTIESRPNHRLTLVDFYSFMSRCKAAFRTYHHEVFKHLPGGQGTRCSSPVAGEIPVLEAETDALDAFEAIGGASDGEGMGENAEADPELLLASLQSYQLLDNADAGLLASLGASPPLQPVGDTAPGQSSLNGRPTAERPLSRGIVFSDFCAALTESDSDARGVVGLLRAQVKSKQVMKAVLMKGAPPTSHSNEHEASLLLGESIHFVGHQVAHHHYPKKTAPGKKSNTDHPLDEPSASKGNVPGMGSDALKTRRPSTGKEEEARPQSRLSAEQQQHHVGQGGGVGLKPQSTAPPDRRTLFQKKSKFSTIRDLNPASQAFRTALKQRKQSDSDIAGQTAKPVQDGPTATASGSAPQQPGSPQQDQSGQTLRLKVMKAVKAANELLASLIRHDDGTASTVSVQPFVPRSRKPSSAGHMGWGGSPALNRSDSVSNL